MSNPTDREYEFKITQDEREALNAAFNAGKSAEPVWKEIAGRVGVDPESIIAFEDDQTDSWYRGTRIPGAATGTAANAAHAISASEDTTEAAKDQHAAVKTGLTDVQGGEAAGGAGSDGVYEYGYRVSVLAAEAGITDADAMVDAATADVEAAKAELKLAEKRREDAVRHLRDVILGRSKTEPTLPFPEGGISSGMKPAAASDQESREEPPNWQDVPIDELGLPANLCQLLQENELNTVGRIADFTSHPNQKLTDIKGVGEAKAELIENALERFWKNRNDAAPDTPDEDAPEDEIDPEDEHAFPESGDQGADLRDTAEGAET